MVRVSVLIVLWCPTLRRLAESDFAKGGAGTEAYVVGVPDLYEVASAFPTGNGVDGLYDWIGLWTFTLSR